MSSLFIYYLLSLIPSLLVTRRHRESVIKYEENYYDSYYDDSMTFTAIILILQYMISIMSLPIFNDIIFFICIFLSVTVITVILFPLLI